MRISLQLYTVRDAMAKDIDGTLAAIKGSGLEYVELAGTYGKPASEFASVLAGHGLKVSGSHTGIEALEANFDQVVAYTKAFDNDWVIVPYIGQDRRNWTELAKTFNAFGQRLRAVGLKFAYH